MTDLSGRVDKALLERELKLSCSNVMLQCLSPETYRKRLSRIRARMADFLREYCGLSGTGMCLQRADKLCGCHPQAQSDQSGFSNMEPCRYEELIGYIEAMDELDDLSQIFAGFPAYPSLTHMSDWIRNMMAREAFSTLVSKEE